MYVSIIADELNLQVVALLDDDAESTSGYGGWEEIERVGRKPITAFRGSPTLKKTLPIILDGYMKREPVDELMRAIERMARSEDEQEPPTVRLVGPVRHADRSWVLTEIDWGEVIRRSPDGAYLRQHAVLSFTEFVDAKTAISKPGKRPKGKKKSKARRHRVKKGETLRTIASKYLGSPKRWKEIADLNGLRAPDRLKVGMWLKLPAK